MKDIKTYTLTKAKIQIMNILWKMPEGGCVTGKCWNSYMMTRQYTE